MKEKLVVIVGPTAVGKTKLSVELAKELNGEVISGDSMQIYRGMDIGTAKIKEEEMGGIVHHLIDIKDPNESFSVAEFQDLVKPLVTSICKKGKLPLLVGGTGLYVNSVIYDYNFPDAPNDPEYRQSLETLVEKNGVITLHEKLKEIDPISYETIHPNNYRRVIRALEVYYVTNKTIHDYQSAQPTESRYELALIGLTMDRTILYDRINRRVDMMIDEGLIDEAKRLYNSGVKDCQSVQAIGYKEIFDYLEGHITKEEAVELLKRNSRRYAKRQLTWFRNKMNIQWFELNEHNFYEKKEEIKKFIEERL
ncbi:tRNA (adenosine(37)-N6)-dimethylallyltransferase MiaA [Anaerobacillus alkalidiazotrophicus]|uniref:tRNA dimethylallyltransferase n=1 Tax=Anaerobacillus alkalidiazotrophicus TaxID=472963 RepID=A0A1S2LZU6_9BACI|nr:tRNA (adenosine(37)-N6)-dimethylallyltransferase MiaA [Anaerobacillus alkalidiazotrophicus]OIJ17916.1 tRNA (adenosine(37)-N6)-dimethylallyltransferase MiaA [Anaerobacillus alkalidiazotrophicus]